MTWHMFICCFSKTNRFKTVPAWYRVIKRLSDTLCDHDKLNQGKYQFCSSKIDMKHVYMLFFKDKSISNSPSVIQGDQEALGHPQRPRQAQPRRVQQIPVMFIKTWYTHVYMLFFKEVDQEALRTPSQPRQAQVRRVQQVPVMFIKMDEFDEVLEGVREPLDQPLINSI